MLSRCRWDKEKKPKRAPKMEVLGGLTCWKVSQSSIQVTSEQNGHSECAMKSSPTAPFTSCIALFQPPSEGTLKRLVTLGCLAGSVHKAWDSCSGGHEFEPHAAHRDYLRSMWVVHHDPHKSYRLLGPCCIPDSEQGVFYERVDLACSLRTAVR